MGCLQLSVSESLRKAFFPFCGSVLRTGLVLSPGHCSCGSCCLRESCRFLPFKASRRERWEGGSLGNTRDAVEIQDFSLIPRESALGEHAVSGISKEVTRAAAKFWLRCFLLNFFFYLSEPFVNLRTFFAGLSLSRSSRQVRKGKCLLMWRLVFPSHVHVIEF